MDWVRVGLGLGVGIEQNALLLLYNGEKSLFKKPKGLGMNKRKILKMDLSVKI